MGRAKRSADAEIVAVMHAHIDAIFDALPCMVDQANAPYIERPLTDLDDVEDDWRVNPDTIYGKGGFTDPTAVKALACNPSRDWLTVWRRTIVELHRLSDRATELTKPASR